MAFIHVKRTSTSKKISINVAHIVSVQPSDRDTLIQTAVPSGTGALQYGVSDTYEDVMKMIENAQVYGPR
ncbi:hypothetical protein ACQZ5N_03240 [Agrobacterium sp. 22-221-1]